MPLYARREIAYVIGSHSKCGHLKKVSVTGTSDNKLTKLSKFDAFQTALLCPASSASFTSFATENAIKSNYCETDFTPRLIRAVFVRIPKPFHVLCLGICM